MTPEDIKRLRLAKGWTQEELAHRMGVTFSTINRWESGKHKPYKLLEEKLVRLLTK